MAGEVNQGYSLSNLSKLGQKYIEFKNADGKVIKISVKPFETEEARKSLISFLGQYYDNGDKGGIKGNKKLEYGELDNLRKDLKRNYFTNEKDELEITEDAIEKITYCIEEKGQKPGIQEEMRIFTPRELKGFRKELEGEKPQSISIDSCYSGGFVDKKGVRPAKEIKFLEILEKFIKEEKQKQNNLDSAVKEDIILENIPFSAKEIEMLRSLLKTIPQNKLEFIFKLLTDKRFTKELERLQP